jgi:hypothetical protein
MGDTYSFYEAAEGYSYMGAAVKILPPTYRWVDYRTLKPYPDIITPVALQQGLISEVRNGELDGHSILYCGPSGTGKTVLASAILTRMVHLYSSGGYVDKYDGNLRHFGGDYQYPIYRVNADHWIDEFESWKLYQFGSDTPRPPQPGINPQSVCQLLQTAKKGDWGYHPPSMLPPPLPPEYPPVLILEEIDKFSPSDFKCRALEGLMNAVFEQRGMIVSTSNYTKDQLTKRFPDWFYRRLVESSGDHKRRLRDLYSMLS